MRSLADHRRNVPADKHDALDAGLLRAESEGWIDEIRLPVDSLAVAEGCYFSEHAATHYVDFIHSHCKHHIGRFRDTPFILAPWQLEIVRAIFGWKRPDGTRRFRRAAIWVPKKNGKSTLCGALALALLVADGEGAPEVYTAAVDRKQAGIVHATAAAMVRRDPALNGALQIIDSTKTIRFPSQDGRLVALSADVASHEGLNISASIIDEIHAHKNRKLLSTLFYGGMARTQPLSITISTAGVYDPESIGWEVWEETQRVLGPSGQDTALYGCIFGASADDDWTDPEVWRKANPSFGSILQEEDFRQDCVTALESPPKQADFKRYRLNIWVQAAEAWCNMDKWAKCKRDFDPKMLHGRPAYGGMDLSAKQDLTAFALCFPPYQDDPLYYLLMWHWLPKAQLIAMEQKHQAQFPRWVSDGLITAHEGEVIDYSKVESDIENICDPFKVQEINYDPFFSGEIVQSLDASGFTMVEHRQTTVMMSPAMNAMETLMLAGDIAHQGNPCFDWQLGNVTTRSDSNGNIAPEKKTNKKKIDGPVAAFMAVGRAVSVGKPKASVYEERGLIVL